MILNDLCIIGVIRRRMAIPRYSSELATIDGPRRSCPKRKVDAAKGRVSSKGALELMLPSLL